MSSNRFRFIRYRRCAITTALFKRALANQRQSYVSSDCPTGPVSWARAQLTGPVGQSLETYDWRWFARARLNNAVVIAQRLYRMNLNLFEDIYIHANANLRETVRAIQVRVFTQPGQDPYQALYSRAGLPAD